jgi:hypothetical protein
LAEGVNSKDAFGWAVVGFALGFCVTVWALVLVFYKVDDLFVLSVWDFFNLGGV